MNGRVSQYLISLVRRQVDDRGIVVWYDPRKEYDALVRRIELPDTEIILFENGFFQLREKLEPLLEYIHEDGSIKPGAELPPRVVIYVPMDRDDTGFALIEAETAGIFVSPGNAEAERNTRLGRIVELVFSELHPAKAVHLARQAEEGLLTLEDLDRMADEAGSAATGALKLIFGQASPVDILIAFVADDSHDTKIEEKKALDEIVSLIAGEIGLEMKTTGAPAALRAELRRNLLLGELALAFPCDEAPAALAGVALPEKPAHRDTMKHLCHVWRSRFDLKETYAATADDLEKAAGLAGAELAAAHLHSCETFRVVDRILLKTAQGDILKGDFKSARELAETRRAMFWSREQPEIQLRWVLILTAAELMQYIAVVADNLKKRKWTLDELIDAYARHGEPWMMIDRLSRHLESRYAKWESADDGDEEMFEKVMTRCRTEYERTLTKLAEAYSSALIDAGFRAQNASPHDEIYRKAVYPAIEKGVKTAYILVDALRYEMANELIEGMADEFQVEIEPVTGQLPGITSVGMSALMPGAEKGVSLDEKASKIMVCVEGRSVNTRADRLAYIEGKAGVPTAFFKLGDVTKMTKKKKQQIADAGLVVVTSQEIDRIGEEGAEEDEARIYIDEVLEKLRRGIRNLASAGVERFVITADHGYILAENLDPGLRMDPPGGSTAELHSRVWIGKGGAAGDGYFRVKADDLGLGGPFEFAFPVGLGTFKVKGGAGAYFHGGPTLQENIIPLCSISPRKGVSRSAALLKLKMVLSKPKITNRFFSLTLELEPEGLFSEGEKRVRLEVLANKKEVGFAALASYGFEEGTKEITVRCGQPNAITVMLKEVEATKSVTIRAIDSETQLQISLLEDVPVDLVI